MSMIYDTIGTAKSLCQFVIKSAVTDSYISLVASERRRKKGGSIMRIIGGNDEFAIKHDSLQTIKKLEKFVYLRPLGVAFTPCERGDSI